MGYALVLGQKAPLLDQDANPIGVADVTGTDGSTPPWHGTIIDIHDDGAGALEVTAGAVGEYSFALIRKSDGAVSPEHTVTVTASPPPPEPAPFDWTLGTPVAA